MDRIKFHDRYVEAITSPEGQKGYYEHLDYWRSCVRQTNRRISPTKEEAEEYLRLKAENPSIFGDSEMRKKYYKLDHYNRHYDWRPTKTGDAKFVGLISPTGDQILPNHYADVFTQFDALNNPPRFIPVSNGKSWVLVSLTSPQILMTDFTYKSILPERWEGKIFFVQDEKTMKWGAFAVEWPSLNENKRYKNTLPRLYQLMPCIADEIYEDELVTEEEPVVFFMTCKGDKIGILTDFGYSDIAYDTYQTDDEHYKFRLISNDRKRAKRVTFVNPTGKKE